MMQQYFEVNYMGDSHAEQSKNLGKLLQLMHAIGTEHKLQFGLSFPDWKDCQKDATGLVLQPGTFGPIVRVFSNDAPSLSKMHQEVKGSRMARAQIVVVSELMAVPAKASLSFAFVRSRTAERQSTTAQLRVQRRQAKRIAEGKRRAVSTVNAHSAKGTGLYNYVAMRSSSNGSSFDLRVARVPAQDHKSNISNSYGLGMLVPTF